MTSRVRGSRLYGTMVIAMEEGLKLGRTSEVYIDPPARKLGGISYKSGTLSTEQETFVHFADILKFSSDVVIIASQAAGGERPAEAASLGLRALKKNKITTQSGTHIALLADLAFDRADGKIVEIFLPDNMRLDIDVDQVIFGQDLIMVPADYEPATTRIEPETKDFINRIFGNAAFSERLREGYEEARNSVRNNVNRERVVHTLRTGSRKAKDTILRTTQAIQQAMDQINRKRQAAKGAGEDEAMDSDAPGDPERRESADAAASQTAVEHDEQEVEKL